MPADWIERWVANRKKRARAVQQADDQLVDAPDLAPGAPRTVIPGIPAQSWADLIRSDPAYQQTLADLGADEATAGAARTSAVRQALIRMGLLNPAMIESLRASLAAQAPQLGEDFDPQTLQLAQSNENSVAAQIARQQQQNQLAIQDQLAARGILRSGQTGFELGENQRSADQARYDAIQQLTDALSGVYGEYSRGVSGRQRARSEAAERAQQRAQELGLNPAPGTPAQTIVQAPPTSAALAAQLRRNARRPVRRPIGGYGV